MDDQIGAEEDEAGSKDRFIVLLRHGLAEEKTAEKPDQERSLTSDGHARMKQIAKGIERAFPKAQVIYSSPLLRAVQTALWVSKGYRQRVKVGTTDTLAPGASPTAFTEFINALAERRVIVVGHEPNLSEYLGALLGSDGTERFELKKGGCYGVRLRQDGTCVFEWLLSPRILRKLAETERDR